MSRRSKAFSGAAAGRRHLSRFEHRPAWTFPSTVARPKNATAARRDYESKVSRGFHARSGAAQNGGTGASTKRDCIRCHRGSTRRALHLFAVAAARRSSPQQQRRTYHFPMSARGGADAPIDSKLDIRKWMSATPGPRKCAQGSGAVLSDEPQARDCCSEPTLPSADRPSSLVSDKQLDDVARVYHVPAKIRRGPSGTFGQARR